MNAHSRIIYTYQKLEITQMLLTHERIKTMSYKYRLAVKRNTSDTHIIDKKKKNRKWEKLETKV